MVGGDCFNGRNHRTFDEEKERDIKKEEKDEDKKEDKENDVWWK